jgi:hypothetical protein
VGQLVGAAAAKNIKPCTLELGGKSAAIVWKDVDVDQVPAPASRRAAPDQLAPGAVQSVRFTVNKHLWPWSECMNTRALHTSAETCAVPDGSIARRNCQIAQRTRATNVFCACMAWRKW